ncbi:acyltransferase [Salinithrix halophila]|uniref:Acyltransferase n=1 Tax=Salinithrix halophila TaxID=1485204 RepID=A0ABV8JAN1_9BACL
MARTFLPEINFLRGLACLGVLIVHVSATYYYKNGQVWDEAIIFLNQIGRFGTPAFAVLSGFLLFYPYFQKPFFLSRFTRSKLVKIVSPFMVWGLFYFALSQWIHPSSLQLSFSQIVKLFGLGQSFYHLYFMSLVIQFYAVFPLLQRWLTTSLRWWVALGGALIVNTVLLLLRADHLDGLAQAVLLEKAILPSWIFYFIFGGFIAFHWERLSHHLRAYAWSYLVIGLLLILGAMLEYQHFGIYTSKRLSNLVNIPLLSLAVFALFSLIKESGWIVRSVMEIGSRGFGIYLIHPLVLFLAGEVLPAPWWHPNLFGAVYVLILVGSILLVKAIQTLPFSQYLLTVPKDPRSSHTPHTRIPDSASVTVFK